jgi:hypothetical protein
MPNQDDPNWGRSKPRSANLEILVVVLSLAAIVRGMIEAISYAREIGRPLGVIGLLELFFRESLMLGAFMLGVLAMACALLWRLLRRVFSKAPKAGDGRISEG